jgi:hypothetical protein
VKELNIGSLAVGSLPSNGLNVEHCGHVIGIKSGAVVKIIFLPFHKDDYEQQVFLILRKLA